MQYDIYYFTGTGNSLHIARRLAELTGSAPPRSIPKVLPQIPKENWALPILIVFPSYLAMVYGVPVIVKEFIEKIPALSSKTLSAVCSCGGYESMNAVPSLRHLARIIEAKGGSLFTYHTLRLPMNNADYAHIPIPIEKDERVLLEKAEKKIALIAQRLQNPQRYSLRKILGSIFQRIMQPLFLLLKKPAYQAMLRLAQVPPDTPLPCTEVFRLTDNSISADRHCSGCGLCARVCPVQNIQLVEKRPVWLHHCEMCFACHEWCPQNAIQHWGRKKGVHYHHPAVTLADFLGGPEK